MNELPNLAGVATEDLVERIGTGKFSAAYINWSRTMHLLRTHAPGWQPELVPAQDGYLLHQAPVGGYLMLRFRKGDEATMTVPQAVMDSRNAAIPVDKITARDITDTHRRGICMAAAMTLGLAYELWAKLPLESGYQQHEEPAPDVFMMLHAITHAETPDELKGHFAAAWKLLTGNDQTKAKAAYEYRKQQLETPVIEMEKA